MTCLAKIRPFPDNTEVACELQEHSQSIKHQGTVRDYAYPGSKTALLWFDSDRRTFRGMWTDCDESTCTLPAGHHGDHAA